ncbi:NH(3)-dependent NAD(+) synthetase [Enterococcus faecium]|nr:NH(3)-dependent NAD(+) synthetase [Enterococcus faecium]
MSLQTEIINELGVKPTIDPKEEIRKSIDFMKAYLKKYPFLKTFVLGISGGQDSTLAGRLAQLTMEEMREETKDENYQFIAVVFLMVNKQMKKMQKLLLTLSSPMLVCE